MRYSDFVHPATHSNEFKPNKFQDASIHQYKHILTKKLMLFYVLNKELASARELSLGQSQSHLTQSLHLSFIFYNAASSKFSVQEPIRLTNHDVAGRRKIQRKWGNITDRKF